MSGSRNLLSPNRRARLRAVLRGVRLVLQDHRKVLGAVAVTAATVLLVFCFWSGDDTPPPRQIRELTVVKIIPPPPPPPPPPPEQKMIEQPKLTEREIKEEKPVEKPKEAPPKESKSDEPPPGPLALDAKADGPPDAFNLGSKPGGRGLLGGGGGGSRWGWYAAIVTEQIDSALRANPKTRGMVLRAEIRLWADASGRVIRVQLGSSTGNSEIDARTA